jgi:hypothetical protein
MIIINVYQIDSYTLLEEIYKNIEAVNIQSFKNENYVYYQKYEKTIFSKSFIQTNSTMNNLYNYHS